MGEGKKQVYFKIKINNIFQYLFFIETFSVVKMSADFARLITDFENARLITDFAGHITKCQKG